MSLDDERKFLHDVINPLSIAQGNLKMALRKMDSLKELDPKAHEVWEKLTKAADACEKMVKLVNDRRQTLMDKKDQEAS